MDAGAFQVPGVKDSSVAQPLPGSGQLPCASWEHAESGTLLQVLKNFAELLLPASCSEVVQFLQYLWMVLHGSSGAKTPVCPIYLIVPFASSQEEPTDLFGLDPGFKGVTLA